MKTVIYLGSPGSLSEEAALAWSQHVGAGGREVVDCRTVTELFAAIKEDGETVGLVPAESSTRGSISMVWDILREESAASPRLCFVSGEIVLPEAYHLLAQRGLKISQITTILGAPDTLAQCRTFVSKHLPGVKVFETTGDAEAARVVAVNDLPLAAVATSRCAQIHRLDVLAENIQDAEHGTMRFLVVSRKPADPTGRDKTSIACAIERDRAGSLYELLDPFARAGVNLTRIESRPGSGLLGDYIFFIDFEGHHQDDAVQPVLDEVSERALWLTVLGSYPAWSGQTTVQ